MKKKPLIIVIIILVIAIFVFMMIHFGVITFDTYSANDNTMMEVASVDQLKDGCYYVWHNNSTDDIANDLAGKADTNVFKLCPTGDPNWDKDTFVNHILWFTSTNDIYIPTLYPGDKLLYVSANNIPYEGINWRRFSDYGYTIGVANLIKDASGHYRIESDDGEDFQGYVYEKSDANEITHYAPVTTLFLDKVGGLQISENCVSAGGTVLNLDKDHDYVCEWYTGTYYQDYKMKANIHAFSFLEEFQTFEFEFLHSNVIEIMIPSWLKTGYYYIDDVGFFRYVSDSYASIYNGKAYDANIYWNDPMILYDEYGNLLYNPATGFDKTKENETLNSEMPDQGNVTGTMMEPLQSNSNYQNDIYDEEFIRDAESGDVGAGEYEYNTDVDDRSIVE